MTIEELLNIAIRYKLGRDKLGNNWTIGKAVEYESTLPRKLTIEELTKLSKREEQLHF